MTHAYVAHNFQQIAETMHAHAYVAHNFTLNIHQRIAETMHTHAYVANNITQNIGLIMNHATYVKICAASMVGIWARPLIEIYILRGCDGRSMFGWQF